MKHLVLLAAFLLAALLPAQAQKHKTAVSQPPKEEVVVVDDESCGCELVFIDGIQTTQRDSLFGFKLADGTELVKPQYRFVDKFHGNYCIVMRDYNKCGLINRQGYEVVPCIYEEINYPSDGRIRVKQNERYGFLKENGMPIIDPQYRAASTFTEGRAVVAVDHDSTYVAYGFIDTLNRMVITAQYQYAYPYSGGYAVVKNYDRYGLIDREGKEVLPLKFEGLSSVDTNGVFFAKDPDGDKWAMFSPKKQLTKYIYDDFTTYGDGFYTFRQDTNFGFIDAQGKEHFKRYNKVGGFANGFCMVMRDGKYGIINERGREILPLEYTNSGYRGEEYMFYEGLALVEKDGKYGYVDMRGRVVIPLMYESGYKFVDGLAPVCRKGLWGYINSDNEVMIPFVFDIASPFEYHRAEVVYNNDVHKINTQGKCVKNCKRFPTY